MRERIQRWWYWRVDAWGEWVLTRPDPLGLLDLRWMEWVYLEWTHRILCALLNNHYAIADQCGKPAHDYCIWCRTPQPGRAIRR